MPLKKLVSVIVPAHNEEGNITVLTDHINEIFRNTPYVCELIFVDDGSEDNTLNEIKLNAQINSNVYYIELARNFGKDYALKAGISLAKGDAVITIDADMQHPPHLIKRMLNYWEDGFDIVYTYREEVNRHARFYQRFTSKLFYRVINALSDIKLENGIADYRLIDAKVVNQLRSLDEYEIFFRGIVKWVGYKQIGIPYTPAKRHAGTASYSFIKLLKFAIGNIMAFSARPLYIAAGVGLSLSALAILYFPYILISYMEGYAVPGWASIMATIDFFGGLQLALLSIIGVYVGKIFMQSKGRPNYIIRSTNLIHIKESSNININ
ncbi:MULTISPECIES: glycosyltransferase family 2 protein [unclassified Mucilaginibacter]|uniref:glycosyltransferase family 2 protein n=1 Tax=unclassified Mucilaginibacter TaxID=2617802 RepID=UPI0009692D00|nr:MULTISPECIES: glycosyltransferase family 2 protein [unclassified Mucilaginibacter]OJW17261.1 MAG: glycosyltransferase [Mucilaginibacter sp. 44-25]PLW89562.1 MAG: glycosyltransferase [Mucilaginibacter sp.]HEK20027.1 glycosyltransferase [Bacteroidota bacterium]